jgi:hypothetical protein
MLSVGSNRRYARGGHLERVRLFGLGAATSNGRAGLRFDFLGQTCSDEFRRDLLRRRALQLRGNRQEAILTFCSCAQQLTLHVTKFE